MISETIKTEKIDLETNYEKDDKSFRQHLFQRWLELKKRIIKVNYIEEEEKMKREEENWLKTTKIK